MSPMLTEERLRSALDQVTSELTLNYRDYPRFDLRSTGDPVPSSASASASASASIVTLHPDSRNSHPEWSTRRRRYRLTVRSIVAIAVAACVVAAAGVVFAVTSSNNAEASVATVLAEAEQNVGASPVPGPGQYLYQQTVTEMKEFETSSGYTWYVDLPYTNDLWVGADGSGRLRVVPGTPTFPSAADRAAWQAAGSPALGQSPGYDDTVAAMPVLGVSTTAGSTQQGMAAALRNAALIAAGGSIGQAVFPYPDVASLPTDPVALQHQLVDRYEGGAANNQLTFSLAASLLDEGASSAQRVAILSMISSLPGVTLGGTVTTDVSHLKGTALTLTENGKPCTIVIDTSTADVLQQSCTLVGTTQDPAGALPPADPSDPAAIRTAKVGWYTVYQNSQVTDTTAAS